MSYGTAPHRTNGVWFTQAGRRLTPAGQAYWEHHHQQGLVTTKGHIPKGFPPSQVMDPNPPRPTPPPFRRSDRQVDRPGTDTQQRVEAAHQRAYMMASRTWDAIKGQFAPTTRDRTQRSMPLVYFGSRSPGKHPSIDLEALPTVPRAAAWPAHFKPARAPQGTVVDQMAMLSPDAANYRPESQNFVDTLLHEMAHTQQNPTVLSHHLQVEGGADAFARLMRRQVFSALGLGSPWRPYYGYESPYFPLSSKFIAQHGRRYATRGQFIR